MKKIMNIAMFIAVTVFGSMAYAAEEKVDIKRSPEEKIGSWYFQCETMQVNGKDTNKVCALVQNFAILGKDKKQEVPVMRLQIHKISQKDKKITFLGVRTPLGIDLASGMKMSIGGKDYKAVPFTTCYAEPLGCRASFPIVGELEAALKGNKDIKIGYRSLEGQVIASDVKTDGYTTGITKF
jgi:invasion protein IalB